MNLYEQYRPTAWPHVVGQDKAVKTVQGVLARGWGGRAWFLSGSSGVGKTTIARIIAHIGAEDMYVTEYDSADELKVADLDHIDEVSHYSAPGKGGRAIIVNEAHGLKAPVIRRLLGILENIPPKTVWIFTTTRDGQEKLFDDQIDSSPLLSRCIEIRLTNQGLAKPFAERARWIAEQEHLDGKPIEAYVRAAQACHNNFRALLQAVEAGQV